MAVAVPLPVLIGLFLLTMRRFRASLSQPLDRDRDTSPRPADADRAAATSGRVALDGGGVRGRERRPGSARGPALRAGAPGGTALHPAVRRVPPSEPHAPGARHERHTAGTGRRGSGRGIEGRGPWTCR